MCWEERHIILSQTTLTILFRTKCFPVFPLQFLQIMMNFARFKNQRTYWMLTATRLWDEKGWCFGEIYQYLPYKPAWGWKWMQQEANSCFQQQFGAVFILLCPFEPQMHTECVHYLRYIHLQLAHCHGSDSDPGEWSASSAEASFGTNIPNQSALWKFLYTGILFRVWDTMCCTCFCKKQAVVQHVISCAQHWRGHEKDNVLGTWHYLRDRFI